MPGEPDRLNAGAPTAASRWKLPFLRTWFGRGPRAHGETIFDRRVNPLELLYDLVYAAVIAQAGHHLARDISLAGIFEYAVVFSLTYVAWTNGTLYLELHGRNDGRTRSYVFLQIGVLAVCAVFAADAGGGSGAAFALAYFAFLVVMTWLWYDVRNQDIALERRQFDRDTGGYVVAMAVSALVILVSAFLPSQPRLIVWAIFSVAWIVLLLVYGRVRVGLGQGMAPTDSLVDRFGTFVLIVLGEVVFGVVAGLALSTHDFATIATGMVALFVGFGFWWMYFDVVGGRLPNGDGRALANWILGHHPITLSIGAAGAGMISLVAHAHDAGAPASTSWLLAGAVAVGFAGVILTSRALADARTFAPAYRSLAVAMAAGVVASVLIGWARPAPWLLAVLLVGVLGAVWTVAVRAFVLAGAWSAGTSPSGRGRQAQPSE